MSEKRFTYGETIDYNFFDVFEEKKYLGMIQRDSTKIVDRLNEQQAIIKQLQKKLSECQGHKLELTPIPISRPVTLKEAEESIRVTKYEELFDDEPFEFNKNCAKPYNIRSVSPNGVVRAGKKNSKVSWRMKDVREIYNELPPFEDFNREIFQQIKNKFHTKFDNDVIGRIIYNIYVGTFEEYI